MAIALTTCELAEGKLEGQMGPRVPVVDRNVQQGGGKACIA